jgi:chemotaxis protein MotB
VAAIFAIAAGGLLFLWLSSKVDQKVIEGLKSQLDDANARLATARGQIATNEFQIAALKAQIAGLQKEKEQVTHSAKSLEDQMRAALESRDVTISQLQGKLTVNILDRIMFDSGEAVLKPGGEPVLKKVAAFLSEHPELKIHVIGHTDNIPIRGKFPSNWELSMARALAAVHFLTDKADVDPRRVGAVGYGEFRPIADNSTPEGRAKNRRIAITILPDELAGADSATVPKPDAAPSASAPKPEAEVPLPESGD